MPSRRPRRRFEDILENIAAIERYVEGMDLASFGADPKTRDAVERCLERISEAASKLGGDGPAFAPDQPWTEIRALGNRLRHEYDRVRADRLWQIVVEDLGALRVACAAAIAGLDAGDRGPAD